MQHIDRKILERVAESFEQGLRVGACSLERTAIFPVRSGDFEAALSLGRDELCKSLRDIRPMLAKATTHAPENFQLVLEGSPRAAETAPFAISEENCKAIYSRVLLLTEGGCREVRNCLRPGTRSLPLNGEEISAEAYIIRLMNGDGLNEKQREVIFRSLGSYAAGDCPFEDKTKADIWEFFGSYILAPLPDQLIEALFYDQSISRFRLEDVSLLARDGIEKLAENQLVLIVLGQNSYFSWVFPAEYRGAAQSGNSGDLFRHIDFDAAVNPEAIERLIEIRPHLYDASLMGIYSGGSFKGEVRAILSVQPKV